MIGFALAWIPYVDYLGALLAVIGAILLVLGRRGYSDDHRYFVVRGAGVYLLAAIANVVLALSIAAALADDASTTTTLSQLGSTINGQIEAYLIGAAVVGMLAALAHVLMVFGLANDGTRRILWAAFLAQGLVFAVILLVAFPLISSAISQSTSGTTFNAAPVTQLETTVLYYGLLGVIPSALFFWAYWRVRESLPET